MTTSPKLRTIREWRYHHLCPIRGIHRLFCFQILVFHRRFYYDKTTSQCKSFTWKGQAGNFNNFLSQDHCTSFCAKTACKGGTPLQSAAGTGIQQCPDTPCPPGYTCATSSKVCCPDPRECFGRITPLISTFASETVCSQPQQTGSCFDSGRRWFFTQATGSCQEFIYSGCQGNDNNFATYTDCAAFCVQGESRSANE